MKSKFVKSTFILIIGGFITKIIGMFIKIVMTRLLGTSGIGMYMLVSPTFMLLISLASLGLPVSVSKLVSEDTRNNKNVVFLCFPITILVNVLILFFLLFFSNFISGSLLHEPRIRYGIMCIGFVLPFIIGIANSKNSGSGFGVIGLIALMPLICVQTLGLESIIKQKALYRMAKRRVKEANDAQIIHF